MSNHGLLLLTIATFSSGNSEATDTGGCTLRSAADDEGHGGDSESGGQVVDRKKAEKQRPSANLSTIPGEAGSGTDEAHSLHKWNQTYRFCPDSDSDSDSDSGVYRALG